MANNKNRDDFKKGEIVRIKTSRLTESHKLLRNDLVEITSFYAMGGYGVSDKNTGKFLAHVRKLDIAHS